MDYPVSKCIVTDLRDRRSVDSAIEELGGSVDAVFACAGVADGTTGLMLINFIAQHHIIERLVESGALRRGGSVVMISSVAGLGWQQNLPNVLDFLRSPGREGQAAWVEANSSDNYAFSKMAINTYVADSALPRCRQRRDAARGRWARQLRDHRLVLEPDRQDAARDSVSRATKDSENVDSRYHPLWRSDVPPVFHRTNFVDEVPGQGLAGPRSPRGSDLSLRAPA